jgi:hypothetical protein
MRKSFGAQSVGVLRVRYRRASIVKLFRLHAGPSFAKLNNEAHGVRAGGHFPHGAPFASEFLKWRSFTSAVARRIPFNSNGLGAAAAR